MGRQPIEPSASGEKKQAASEKKGQAQAGPEAVGPLWDANPIQLKRAAESPFSASRASILGLQRTIGNRATSRLLNNARQRRSAPAAGGANGVVQAKAGGVDAPAAPGRANSTGLPDSIKAGLEGLSGCSLDDVKVHYNSGAPARIRAKAFTKGTDIHVAPGQEQHVAHEGWHVVQQKQGRVRPTLQLKGESLNDDSVLEREADEMGARAQRFTGFSGAPLEQRSISEGVIQGKVETSSLRAFIAEQVALQTEKKARRDEHESAEDDAEDDTEEQEDANNNSQVEEQESDADHEESGIYFHNDPLLDPNRKQYTTVGFEHEFGEMKDGPLQGVTHLELAESSLRMPYTGLPFFIETDASNAIELVSPPFLIETLPDSPVPDADDVEAVDELFKDTLADLAKNGQTMSGLVHLFEADVGLRFNIPDTLHVERKNMTQNTGMGIYNNTWGKGLLGSDKSNVSKLEVQRIQIGTTTKCGDLLAEYHISTHVNFAADAETYDDLQEQYHGGGDIYQAAFASVESQLRDLLFGSALGDKAEDLQGDRDSVRDAVGRGQGAVVQVLDVIQRAVSSARFGHGAPFWTYNGNWTSNFVNGYENSVAEAKALFEKVNKALAAPHMTPFELDDAIDTFKKAVQKAVWAVKTVRDRADGDFPKDLAHALWSAEIEAFGAANALQGMPITSYGKENVRVFLNTLARNLSGQLAVTSIKAVKEAQEKRYASSLSMNKFKPSLMPDQMLSSRVKDVKEVWIKDTVMNIGLGILKPEEWQIVQRVMNDESIRKAVGQMKLPPLTLGKGDDAVERPLPTEAFQRGVLGALDQISAYIEAEELTKSEVDPKKFIGPDQQPDFMSHDPKWIGPRQDTYIVSKRVQMPEMWGSKRLHVVELRKDAAERLRKIKQYRIKHGRDQIPQLAGPKNRLPAILEEDEQLEHPSGGMQGIIEEDPLAPPMSGPQPILQQGAPSTPPMSGLSPEDDEELDRMVLDMQNMPDEDDDNPVSGVHHKKDDDEEHSLAI
jgi:hypothetical protein